MQFNSFKWLRNFSYIFLLNGSKSVQNVIQMECKRLWRLRPQTPFVIRLSCINVCSTLPSSNPHLPKSLLRACLTLACVDDSTCKLIDSYNFLKSRQYSIKLSSLQRVRKFVFDYVHYSKSENSFLSCLEKTSFVCSEDTALFLRELLLPILRHFTLLFVGSFSSLYIFLSITESVRSFDSYCLSIRDVSSQNCFAGFGYSAFKFVGSRSFWWSGRNSKMYSF